MGKKRYYIWGRRGCPFCIYACEYLYERGELYDFFDHEEDEKFLSKIKSFYDHETIPVVVENDVETGGTKFIGGFDDLKEHFEEREEL